MGITDDVRDALYRYFTTLTHTGYKPFADVRTLLTYCFIEEMMTGDMAFFITEEDYRDIGRALQCMYGTCMTPFASWRKFIEEEASRSPDEYRITEDNVLRGTETPELRARS